MPINFDVPLENTVEMTNGQETGICMSISCFWLQRCRTLQGVPPHDDLFFTDWRHYETMGIAFETILADYNEITGGDAMIGTQRRLIQQGLIWHGQFEQQLHLRIMEVNWGTVDTLNFLISLMEGGQGGRYLMTGYATENADDNDLQNDDLTLNGGHTVAFCYDPPGHNATKTFMDPNFGQYTVARAHNWMAAIIGHLTGTYDDFNQWVLVWTV